jgi:hypothetical protein
VRFGAEPSFAGQKPVSGVHLSVTLPGIRYAAFLVRPLTCLFISPIMYRSLAVASTRRASQSPSFGALYADR